jgi:VCBS repeat-containing protein
MPRPASSPSRIRARSSSADPSYNITVDSSDGTLHSQQTFTVSVVTNLAPAIDTDGSGPTAAKSVAENQTAVTTVHATDPDAGPSPVSYSIVGGDDQLKFNIDSSTGVLTFIAAPDFENPTDTATSGNNTYIVTVRAFDGLSSDDQTITVTVTDANDAPVITTNGAGATASININENTLAVTQVQATDQDSPAQTLTYSLAAAADQGQVSRSTSSTGGLTLQFRAELRSADRTSGGGTTAMDRHRPRQPTNARALTAWTTRPSPFTSRTSTRRPTPPPSPSLPTADEACRPGPAYIPITLTGHRTWIPRRLPSPRSHHHQRSRTPATQGNALQRQSA